MNYLAIDTSGFHLTVIAKGERGKYVYFNPNCALRHSVMVMQAVEEALSKANLKKEEVDVFCCCVGPGSFTGIRIGVATVKGLAYALNKKVLGVNSFEALAYNKVADDTLALVDAKHGHVYAGGFKRGEATVAPCYISIEEANGYKGEYAFISSSKIDGVEAEEVDLAGGFYKAVEAKLGEATEDLESLIPLYIRKSQAEEGR